MSRNFEVSTVREESDEVFAPVSALANGLSEKRESECSCWFCHRPDQLEGRTQLLSPREYWFDRSTLKTPKKMKWMVLAYKCVVL